jgi:hypothetical protein
VDHHDESDWGQTFRWHHRQQTGSSSYEGEEKL